MKPVSGGSPPRGTAQVNLISVQLRALRRTKAGGSLGSVVGDTNRLMACVSLSPLLSVAVSVSANAPASVGLPLRVRVAALKAMPCGSVPVRA